TGGYAVQVPRSSVRGVDVRTGFVGVYPTGHAGPVAEQRPGTLRVRHTALRTTGRRDRSGRFPRGDRTGRCHGKAAATTLLAASARGTRTQSASTSPHRTRHARGPGRDPL